MKYFMVIIITVMLATNVTAADSLLEEDSSYCARLGNIARVVIEARRDGIPIDELRVELTDYNDEYSIIYAKWFLIWGVYNKSQKEIKELSQDSIDEIVSVMNTNCNKTMLKGM